MEQILPPSVTATRTQSPYPPSYRNRSSATHFNITLDNTPLRFPHRISAGLTRVQDICYLAIPGFRPPLAIHKHLYINFDTEPHPLSHTTCELQQILQALFYSWKSLILRYTAPVNTTSASSFMLNMRHSMPQSPHLRTMAYALSVLLLQMTSKCHFSSIAFRSKWPDKYTLEKSFVPPSICFFLGLTTKIKFDRGRISSVGRALDCRAGGRGFDSRGRTNT